MARVVVVGGGFGGLASAARLAKLGHEVTLLERGTTLGGAVGFVESRGFTWDTGPSATLLPAVIRDLFRKSGRPLERELELVPQEIIREHRFEDETSVRLPGGSRAAQLAAFDELGPGLGEAWCAHVSSYTDDWELIRRDFLERPWVPEVADRAVSARIFTRESLAKRLKKTFKDNRLRLVAGHPFVFEGHDVRNVPAWLGLTAYLEQNFGAWTVPGGLGALSTALTDRLATRGVDVQLGTEVTDLVLRDGRAVAVATGSGSFSGSVDADLVVCAVDPRGLPALAPYVVRTMPAIPPMITHLGLTGDVPDLPTEVVFHGDPMIVVRTGGRAPEGGHAWTVLGRGQLAEDIVLALARKGVNVRANVETRVDRSPRVQVEQWGSSPMGVLWQGRDTLRHRLGPRTPVPNVYAAGAHANPGAGLPFVGLSAALVAQEIGPA
jgi:phytoene dehydrogenase-like protein